MHTSLAVVAADAQTIAQTRGKIERLRTGLSLQWALLGQAGQRAVERVLSRWQTRIDQRIVLRIRLERTGRLPVRATLA